jgi:hypothetical protein
MRKSEKNPVLVVSSIRIDTDQMTPELGPYTKNFVPSKNTPIFLSNSSIEKSNKVLRERTYRIQPDQEILSHFKQVQSKYHEESTYNICRFHYIHTIDLISQLYTIYTLAACDSIRETDDILGSQLFQNIALEMYDSKKLDKDSIRHLLKNRSKKTTVVKAIECMLELFENDEMEILGNKKLNSILKEIAKIITINGLKTANEKTVDIIWKKFKRLKQ